MLPRTIDFLQSEERLEYLIDKVMGQCADCKEDCEKAHPSHHGKKCRCCEWMEENRNEVIFPPFDETDHLAFINSIDGERGEG